MITLGVDLASKAKKTGMCQLAWEHGSASIKQISTGATDTDIIELALNSDIVAVDVPFGWPSEFVTFISAHSGLADATTSEADPIELRWRSTDRRVFEETGLRPLSVSSDKIAAPALRWARFERLWKERTGESIDRTGSGRFAEVYPAAALHVWGLPSRAYKGAKRSEELRSLLAKLDELCPFLDVGGHTEALGANDDMFDALVCALLARAVALGLTQATELPGEATAEGWIHLPSSDSLGSLAAGMHSDG